MLGRRFHRSFASISWLSCISWMSCACAFAFMAACSTPTGTDGGTASGAKCVTANDCTGGMACVGGICTANECDANKKCPTGKTCVSGACKAIASDASGDGDNGDATVGSDEISSDVSPGEDAIGTDAVINTDTSTGPDNTCHTCKTDDECSTDGSFQCVTMLTGNFCAKKCSAASECATGFSCEKADSKAANSNCLPPGYTCSGCLLSGCGTGESCIAKTGKCAKVKGQCDECAVQTDCADGFKCVKLGATKVCAPTCDNGASCPENSGCQKTIVGNVCSFNAATCCYGPNCTPASACASCVDKCFGGACVECLKDTDCKNGKCDANNHTCITSGPCAAPTPIKLTGGKCVECTNDTHCAGSAVGPKCDISTNTCAASSATNECKVCADPLPNCVEISGSWSCVECSTDADCAAKKAGTCSGTTYSCSGTVATGSGPKTGNCKADSDCVNVGTTNFTLACDTSSGLCYDTAGKCDNLVAFCNAAQGSNCVQPSSVGGLPGLPGGGGGTTNPGEGVCSCATGGGTSGGSTMSPICTALMPMIPTLKNCDCATAPTDAACNGPMGPCCSGGSSGGGGGLPTGLFDCLQSSPDPACFGALKCGCSLFSSLGGASGGSKAPKNCSDGSGSPFGP